MWETGAGRMIFLGKCSDVSLHTRSVLLHIFHMSRRVAFHSICFKRCNIFTIWSPDFKILALMDYYSFHSLLNHFYVEIAYLWTSLRK
jgi:hypothetical protein